MRISRNRYRRRAGFVAAVFDKLFCVYCCCWLIIHTSRWLYSPIPLLNNWLTDAVFIPFVAHIALVFVRQYIVRNSAYKFPLAYLLFAAFYVSILYEGVLPLYHFQTTRDPLDVVAYFAGALFYFAVHQRLSKTIEIKTTTV